VFHGDVPADYYGQWYRVLETAANGFKLRTLGAVEGVAINIQYLVQPNQGCHTSGILQLGLRLNF